MKAPILLTFAGVAAAFAVSAQTPSTPSLTLLVLSKGDLTLSTVDPSTLKVVGRVPSGPDPHEVIASTNGRTAYISNYGGGSFNTITPVDLVAEKALEPIQLGAIRGPHGLVFAGGKLWFTAEGSKAIGRYDPATKQVDLVLGTGQNRTHMLYVFPDLNRVVTSNITSASMTLIERATTAGRGGGGGGGRADAAEINWDETVIPVGRGAEGFDVSPDGKQIWAANAQDGTISVIDVAAKKVIDTVAANVASANRLKFTPDGKRVLVSSLRLPDLAIFDANTRKETKRIPVGRGAAGLEVQPDGARAFVSCTPDNYVAVIDLASEAVAGKIDAGKQPDGLAWAVRR
jgi:YVTN family beta-propeller protein